MYTTSPREKKIKLKVKNAQTQDRKNIQAKKIAHALPLPCPLHSKIKWSVSYEVFLKNNIITTGKTSVVHKMLIISKGKHLDQIVQFCAFRLNAERKKNRTS